MPDNNNRQHTANNTQQINGLGILESIYLYVNMNKYGIYNRVTPQ
jgi:hypothetical protein